VVATLDFGDPRFWYGVKVHAVETPTGKLLVSGNNRILRYTRGGRLDRSFGSNGVLAVTNADGTPFALTGIAVDSENRIVVVGNSEPFGRAAILRFEPDGAVDTSFGGGDGTVLTDFGISTVPDPGSCSSCPLLDASEVAVDSHDRIVVSGSALRAVHYCTAPAAYVGRLDAAGNVDTDYGSKGAVVYGTDRMHSADGLLLDRSGGAFSYGWDGYCHGDASEPEILVSHLDGSGAPFAGFGSDGLTPVGDYPKRLALDRFNHLFVLERSALARLRPDGKLDRSFGERGVVKVGLPGKWSGLTGIDVTPTGGAVVTGRITSYAKSHANPTRRLVLARIGARGRLDTSFGPGGLRTVAFGPGSNALGRDVLLDGRGHAVVAGMVQSKTLPAGEALVLWRFLLR